MIAPRCEDACGFLALELRQYVQDALEVRFLGRLDETHVEARLSATRH